eukprot:2185939-Prymnesium_polylepis.1
MPGWRGSRTVMTSRPTTTFPAAMRRTLPRNVRMDGGWIEVGGRMRSPCQVEDGKRSLHG